MSELKKSMGDERNRPVSGRAPGRLRARTSGTLSRLLECPATIPVLVRGLGSPLNIILPEVVTANARALSATLGRLGVASRIYFTSKPNRSNAILKEVSVERELGVDVSSVGSLRAAMNAGISTGRLEATGQKDIEYLTLCLQHGILVNVDSFSELESVAGLHGRLGLSSPAAVTVRLGGFGIESGSCSVSDGLFGVSVTEIGSLLDYLVAHRTRVDLKGFSYHFNSDSLDFRALATARTIKAVLQARERGLSPSIVNIGGGLRIAYAECAEEWKQFLVDMKQSVTGRGPGVSWNRTGLGFRLEGERVTGSLQVVEHFTRGEPAEQLEALLETRLPSFGELPTAQVLDELGLELHIEPGRALLDQAGVTIGEVAFIKASEQGQQLVGLRMNRTNLNAHELTILTDPIPVGPARVGDPVGVFLMGNTCIANELLCPRKVWLPALPRPGSLLAFVNTAAYSMDFGESYVLHHRVAEKVAVRESKEEKFIWFRDSDYVPSILEVIHAR